MSQHKYLTNNDNHPTVSLVFADATARASATNPITGSAYTSDDIGRMCFQSDTEAFYLLQDTTPTWLTAGSAASGISDIVEDTTPQLGGDLDLNGNSIDFPTTANISDVLDEDNMASNSATKLATQQSIKAYADTKQAKPSEGAFVDGDKTKLDGIETGADVTDATNVTAAGALMDSEVTNLSQVKAFDTTDYATAAQGATADSALQPSDIASGTITARADDIDFSGGTDGDVLTVQADGSLAPETPVAGGLSDLVDDTTPQLGGSLDVNGNKIVSTSDGNIDIEPHGTGNVLLGNYTFNADQTVGAGQDNYVMTYDNSSGLVSLEAAAGGGDFADGGDLGGANRTLGNTDAYELGFLTNNTKRMKIQSNGATVFFPDNQTGTHTVGFEGNTSGRGVQIDSTAYNANSFAPYGTGAQLRITATRLYISASGGSTSDNILQFSSDANTGISQLSGADTLSVVAGGTENTIFRTTKLDIELPIEFKPGTSVTPTNNGDVVFEFTNNTTITVKGKGSDSTVRSGTITLS